MAPGRPVSSQRTLKGLRALLVVLVALSSGLTAVFADASLPLVGGATLLGVVFGLLVVAVALPKPREKPADPRLQWDE